MASETLIQSLKTTFEYRGGGGEDIPRADIAQAVIASLATEETIGETIRLFGGATPIEEAIRPDT